MRIMNSGRAKGLSSTLTFRILGNEFGIYAVQLLETRNAEIGWYRMVKSGLSKVLLMLFPRLRNDSGMEETIKGTGRHPLART